MSTFSRLLGALGVDADDLRVIAAGIILVVVAGLLLIALAGAMGLAVNAFEEMRGI